ncbi:tyrosine-protein kinase STYK1 isoform X1 [Pristis pectinata]|uniref:tyrosine-protein kinase STYK1 isoform X1 n=1 Tax=Pristis pectinata TaxID=685728 RepID=UPI00223E1718|nr:tyrosine-protein kinase STYK1 isoform X1 [Pristis pectinata]XP_051895326.1 tyrosine-protein kinase STYK1 isoform X1 [Pristis pectinata]XP_051895327.1 tyrosine-protein kinase STYK1 isoform X1 [Pristis pectinata]XP_051895328.1 tyrosine-protein kinase STYK1 isoform X1 [Pristis pectinata]
MTLHCNFSTSNRCNVNGINNGVIIIPVILGISSVVLITIIIWKTCKMKQERDRAPVILLQGKSESVRHLESENGLMSNAMERILAGKDPSLKRWEIPPEHILGNLEYLQSGSYGPMYTGNIRSPDGSAEVKAVFKSLHDNASAKELSDFLDLLKFHTKICNHESIVKLLGCQTERMPLYLFLEFVSGGNLLHSLWKFRETEARDGEREFNLTERSVYSIAKQVACGLEYLTTKHHLIHGDVAARNVLIHNDLTVKLTGLSLAFDVYKTRTLSSHKAAQVPIKWLAPERIMKLPITEKSDTWSFGILVYEIITLGSPPYPEFQPLEVFPKLQRNYRMPKPSNSSSALYDLMKHCWQWRAYDRPNWSELINKLSSLMNAVDGVELLQVSDSLDLDQYKQAAGVF